MQDEMWDRLQKKSSVVGHAINGVEGRIQVKPEQDGRGQLSIADMLLAQQARAEDDAPAADTDNIDGGREELGYGAASPNDNLAFHMASQLEHDEDIIMVTPVPAAIARSPSPPWAQSPLAPGTRSRTAVAAKGTPSPLCLNGKRSPPTPSDRRIAAKRARQPEASTRAGACTGSHGAAAQLSLVRSPASSGAVSSDGEWEGAGLASFMAACDAAEADVLRPIPATPDTPLPASAAAATTYATAKAECRLCGVAVDQALLGGHEIQVGNVAADLTATM